MLNSIIFVVILLCARGFYLYKHPDAKLKFDEDNKKDQEK